MSKKLDYHALMAMVQAAVARGKYGPYAIEGYYSSKWDQPIQIALRHRDTGRVVLADLHSDGMLSLT